MRYKLLVFMFLFMSGCSRTELPTACKSLQPFMESQKQQIQSMHANLNQHGKNGFPQINEISAKLNQEQENILRSCTAPIIARGPDCLEFHLIGDISAAQMRIRTIEEVSAGKSAMSSEKVMSELLNYASKTDSKIYEQRACVQN